MMDENLRRKSVVLDQLLESQMIQGVDFDKFDCNDFWMPQLGHGTGSDQFIDFASLE
jgi:hypothetical protein